MAMWKEHKKPLTTAQAIAIAKRIDKMQSKIQNLVLELKYGHPNGEALYRRLVDNDILNHASAVDCIEGELVP